MKPVDKGEAQRPYAKYQDAKNDLIGQIGPHCSYCEVPAVAPLLDVEHIYPKGAHPKHENRWDNLLLACTPCNSKKHAHLGSGRQRGLRQRYLWPHVDNTARAFEYFNDGRVAPSAHLSPAVRKLANATIEMVGIMKNPARARSRAAVAVALTGVEMRGEMWAEAEDIRRDYLENPRLDRAQMFARNAARTGHFSIWMEVFHDRPEFRRELISTFKADPRCFDRNTQPIPKGRS